MFVNALVFFFKTTLQKQQLSSRVIVCNKFLIIIIISFPCAVRSFFSPLKSVWRSTKKAVFHSAKNVARSISYARSLLRDQIEQIQKRALKIILPNQSYHESLNTMKLPTLTERKESLCMSRCARFYKKNNNDTSSKLFELLPKPINHEHNLRHARKITLFKYHILNDLVIVVYPIA